MCDSSDIFVKLERDKEMSDSFDTVLSLQERDEKMSDSFDVLFYKRETRK